MTAERAAFARGLFLLATALDRELDEPQVAVYWHALKGVPAEIRRLTLARASEQTWRRFPQPGELKALAATVLQEQRQSAARRHLGLCDHTGHWLEDESGRLARCPCWRRAMTAMANVGAALALPAHEDEDDSHAGI